MSLFLPSFFEFGFVCRRRNAACYGITHEQRGGKSEDGHAQMTSAELMNSFIPSPFVTVIHTQLISTARGSSSDSGLRLFSN